MSIEVIPIGTRVTVGDDITGVIQSIVIRPGDVVQYDVEWWSGRDRKSDYFYNFQLKAMTSDRASIGFGG